jgi:hypothetical protein
VNILKGAPGRHLERNRDVATYDFVLAPVNVRGSV